LAFNQTREYVTVVAKKAALLTFLFLMIRVFD